MSGNYVGGDQFNMHGDHNVGKIDQRTGPSGATVNSLTVIERAQAIGELATFLDYLQGVALITPSGQVTNAPAIDAEMTRHEAGLGQVVRALSAGAGQMLTTALNHVAAPVVLELIERHFGLR